MPRAKALPPKSADAEPLSAKVAFLVWWVETAGVIDDISAQISAIVASQECPNSPVRDIFFPGCGRMLWELESAMRGASCQMASMLPRLTAPREIPGPVAAYLGIDQ